MKVKLLEDHSTKDSTVSALNFSTSATESDGSGIDDFGLRFYFHLSAILMINTFHSTLRYI